MISRKWILSGVLSIVTISNSARAQQAIDLPVNQVTSYKGEEFLLIGNAVRGPASR